MFEFVRTHQRWLQAILLLLILPSFVALGVQGYSSFADGVATKVASVDGRSVTQGEWDSAVREQAERVRRENPQVDAKLLDTPEAKRQALENLVTQRVIASSIVNQHLEIADARVQSVFSRSPSLAMLRTPEGKPNRALLAAQGMTAESFAERLRYDLAQQQAMAPGQMVPTSLTAAAKLAFDAVLQEREVNVLRLEPSAFRDQVLVQDDEVRKHYQLPETQKRWQQAERARIEYLVLDLEALRGKVQVSEDDLKAFYEQNKQRYGTAQERRARHILIKLEPKADAAAEKAARAQLEALQDTLRKDPKQFAELARKHSQDEVSAANGGDLDFFAREAMVKPFADAAFALKVGELSPIIRSDFGLHLIQLEAIRGGDVRKFDDVRAEIETEQRTELARKRYQELSEQFSNSVYEQADSLQPIAEKLGLKVATAEVMRKAQGGASGPLGSSKLLEAVFAEDSVRHKRNTEAVETAPQQLVSARIVEHFPAAAPDFERVKDAVKEQLVLERAAALAKKSGEEQLKALAADPDKAGAGAGWTGARKVSRGAASGMPRDMLERILRADGSKLPAVLGIDLGAGGYALVKLTQISAPDAQVVPPTQAAIEFGKALGAAESAAYLEALKRQYKAKILVDQKSEGSSK
ncbi:peptidylprolyl isomerase [Inhella gelatinilytica]|uniref:Periplasmic chaperone PpiD n=1 Tax=Inhella gelatinilytica TaxID=2795030 RepID=A0A931J0N1_9BURK|nr:SurA N-terminal domain-containing protein [Inhella gelatinilytica]MBH9553358.1 SurA N-terminal domain-containing protein [Inhella gelatinilytica]